MGRITGAVAAAAVVGGVCAPAVAHVSTPAVAHAATRVSTRILLAQLTVAREHGSGYQRSRFKLWDSQGGGCDTRDRVLITEATTRPHVSSSCALTHGRWRSPYDGVTTSHPSTFDIDHLVPLAEAWQSGAYRWTDRTREAYANDLGYGPDLVAVSAHANRSKGDDEPAGYLPPRRSFRCTYEAWWVAVKWRWHLSVNPAEKSWLGSHLKACGWPTVTKPSRRATSTSGGGSGGGASTSGAAITAIYFDSPGKDTGSNASVNAEWVRIKNTTRTSRTLTGWTLHDASTHVYQFRTFHLGAGKTVRVHSGSGSDTGANLYWHQGYVWNNTGDTATLRNAAGKRIDRCRYTSSADPEARC